MTHFTDSIIAAARSGVHGMLNVVAQKDKIQQALGIEDASTMEDSFWEIQRLTAKNRTFKFILACLNMPTYVEIEDLNLHDLSHVGTVLEAMIGDGVTYTDVREWYKLFGRAVIRQERRHIVQQRYIKSHALFMFAIFDGGAAFVRFGNEASPFTPVLVKDQSMATMIAIHSLEDVSKQNLQQMADDLEETRKVLGAKQLKVLVKSIAEDRNNID